MALAAKHNGMAGERVFASRLLLLPVVLAGLLACSLSGVALDGQLSTIVATSLILLFGIPHGALDIEVAMMRFGKSAKQDKLMMILFYLIGAAGMAFLWWASPPAALALFLVISIIHFGGDWDGGLDPFLGVMIGWAIISAPAFFRSDDVAVLFGVLTSAQDDGAVAAVLAATAVPALLGSTIFLVLALSRGEYATALQLASCLIAAVSLPPLVGFALYFCLLHSPRHLADAFRQAGVMSQTSKALTCIAVTLLSFGLGAILYQGLNTDAVDARILRAGFILLSVLTVPHFTLEMIMSSKKISRAEAH